MTLRFLGLLKKIFNPGFLAFLRLGIQLSQISLLSRYIQKKINYFVVLNFLFHRKDGNVFSRLKIFLYLTHTYLPLTHIKERDACTLSLHGYIILVLDPKAKYLEVLQILSLAYTVKLLNVYKRGWTRIAECQLSCFLLIPEIMKLLTSCLIQECNKKCLMFSKNQVHFV